MMNDSIDFSDSKLHASVRSPFARRVRIALSECGISYRERLRDVWVPNPDFVAINPIHRVPALELRSGAVLLESSLILEAFYRSGSRVTDYGSSGDYLRGIYWSGIAIGLIEKMIERFLETLRPESHRDPEFMNDLPVVIERVFPALEREIGDRKFLCGTRLSQGDIDLACAMTYLRFRFDQDFLKPFPNVARYLDGLESRSAFASTRPS